MILLSSSRIVRSLLAVGTIARARAGPQGRRVRARRATAAGQPFPRAPVAAPGSAVAQRAAQLGEGLRVEARRPALRDADGLGDALEPLVLEVVPLDDGALPLR